MVCEIGGLEGVLTREKSIMRCPSAVLIIHFVLYWHIQCLVITFLVHRSQEKKSGGQCDFKGEVDLSFQT